MDDSDEELENWDSTGLGVFDVIVTTLEGLLYGEPTRVRGVSYQADGAGNSTCYEGLSSTIHTRHYLMTSKQEVPLTTELGNMTSYYDIRV